MATPAEKTGTSVQCVDNPDGFGGVVVNGNITYPISFHQNAARGTANSDGQGPNSSVRVFQRPCYGVVEDITIRRGPPETVRVSNASLDKEK